MKYNKNGKESKYSKLHTIQSRKIIEVAYKLFITRSFNDVSMKDIARKAHISRQTLYKYFPSIDDLLFAIQAHILDEISRSFPKADSSNQSGRAMLIQMQAAVLHYGINHADEFYFISLFDNYNRNRPSNPVLTSRYEMLLKRDSISLNLIQLGQKDGSIRTDIDPTLVSYLLHNQTEALALRFSTMGERALPPDHSLSAEAIEKFYLHIVDRDLDPRSMSKE